MRLRLNSKLRAALIAAVTAVGFTTFGTGTIAVATGATLLAGQQAAAEEAITLTMPATANNGGHGYVNATAALTNFANNADGGYMYNNGGTVSPNVARNEGILTTDAGITSVDLMPRGGAGGSGEAIVLAGSELDGKALSSFDLSLGASSSEGVGGYLSLTLAVVQGEGSSWSVLQSNSGTLNIGESTTLTLTLGSPLDWGSEYKVVAVMDNTGKHLSGGAQSIYILNNIQITAHTADKPVTIAYTWSGTPEAHGWSDSVWTTTEAGQDYVTGGDVVFDGSASYKTVTVDAAVTAGAITVSGAVHTIELANDLTATSLSIAEGSGIQLSGSGALNITGKATVAGGSLLSVGADATLKLDNGASAKALMMGSLLDNKGTLVVNADVTISNNESTTATGTLVMKDHQLKLGSAEGNTINIESFSNVVLDGGTILYSANASSAINGLTVENGKTGTVRIDDITEDNLVFAGTTKIDGTLNLSNNWNSQFKINKLVGEGTLSTVKGGNQWMTLTIDSLSDGDQKFTGAINIAHDNGDAKDKVSISTGDQEVSFRALSLDLKAGHALNFALQADTTIGQMTLTRGTANFAGAHTLTVGGVAGSGPLNVAGNLTFNGTGTSEYTGALTVGGQIVKTGAGSQTLGGFAINKAILVQEGTLVLTGEYSIDGIETVGDNYFVNDQDEKSNSGFSYQSGAKTVYTRAENATLTTTGAVFKLNNEAVELNAEGKYVVNPTTDKTTVWVNGTDTIDYDTYYEASGETPALTTAKVADGATLILGTHAVGTLACQTNGGTINLSGTGAIGAISGAGTLNLNADADATLSGTVTVNGGETFATTGAGALTVETLKVNGGTANIASNLTVTGGGDGKGSGNNSKGLFITGSGSTVNINEGTTKVTGAVYMNGTGTTSLNVGTGGKDAILVARRIELGDAQSGTGALTIGEHGKVVVTGNEDIRTGGNPQKNTSLQLGEWIQRVTTTVSGKLYAREASAFLSKDAADTINITGGTMAVKGIATIDANNDKAHTLTISNNGKLILGELGLPGEAGAWNITVGNAEIGMYADTEVGRALTLNGDLTFNTTKYIWEGSEATLNLKAGEEGGTMTVSGPISGAGSITKAGDGTLIIDELYTTTGSFTANSGDVTLGYVEKTGDGAYSIGGAASYKLEYGIDLQAGTLTLSGAYDISDLYVDGDETFIGGKTEGNVNGFATENGTAQVVTITGGELVASEATFTYCGSDAELDAQGAASVSGTRYDVFYVNEQSEAVSTALEGPEELASIIVAEGARLDVDQDINASLISDYSSGIVNIASGKVVTSDGQAREITLAGSGTYKLQDTVRTMDRGVTLGDDWTGIVEISGNMNGGHNFQGISKASSYVKLHGVTTWLSHNTVEANLIMEGTDSEKAGAALNINATDSGATYTFAGAISGSGDFAITQADARSPKYRFTGDLSAWTGSIVNYNGNAGTHPSLQFYVAGEATIGAGINAKAGVLDVVMGGGDTTSIAMNGAITMGADATLNLTVAKSTTFAGAVTASAITVNADATATFNELHITSAIANSGTVVFNSNLAVSGFTEQAGAAGYYDLDNVFTTDGNGYKGVDNSYIMLVDGGSVTGTITVTQGDTTYNLSNSGNAVHNGTGSVTDYGTFYVNTGSVDISSIAAASQETTAIKVSNGTLNVDTDVSGIAITVTESGTISGEAVKPTQVGIDTDATAEFTKPVKVSGVEFTAAEGQNVMVVNSGEIAQYTTDNANMNVMAKTLTMTDSDNDVTVSNAVRVDEVVNTTGHKLTLDNVDAELGLELEAMTIGAGSTVAVYTDNTAASEGTVTITESLVAGGGTLLADLTLVGHEPGDQTLLLYWDLNGTQMTLGSTLTLDTADGLIQLDDATMRQIAGLEKGESWTLVLNGGTGLDYEGSEWFDGVFSRTFTNAQGAQETLGGDYNVKLLEDGSFGVTKYLNVPEPTTGTLSLLALAALAARRRRK